MSKGRFARQKGKRGERQLASELREAFPHYAADIRRGWQSRLGSDEPDVMGVPGYHFEHKNTAKPNCLAALRQAIADAKPGTVPLAVLRQARTYPVACLRWEDLLSLLVELDTYRRGEDNEPDSVPPKPRRVIRFRRKQS